MEEVYGGPGDDLVRGGTPERPNDGARDVLDCGEGTDTACYVEDQDTVRGCEIASLFAVTRPARIDCIDCNGGDC